jgi:hypothetical protein
MNLSFLPFLTALRDEDAENYNADDERQQFSGRVRKRNFRESQLADDHARDEDDKRDQDGQQKRAQQVEGMSRINRTNLLDSDAEGRDGHNRNEDSHDYCYYHCLLSASYRSLHCKQVHDNGK